ncbi:hypothetical protein BJY52DRAFT_1307789 [Lactarius psammicola]|nr:hypothetical protein BJY52DRAFT_1307789 [Lactarius psammicola]
MQQFYVARVPQRHDAWRPAKRQTDDHRGSSLPCAPHVPVGFCVRFFPSITRHRGTTEQPWNCPHGRPMMGHLSGVGTVEMREWIGRRSSRANAVAIPASYCYPVCYLVLCR